MILERAIRHLSPDITEVLYASNGLEGLEALDMAALNDQTIDLVLCDVHMPVMSGLEFLQEKLRRNLAPGVPVAMITADATDPQVLKAVAEGAQGYISKPFTLEQIHSCLSSLLHLTAVPLYTGGTPWR